MKKIILLVLLIAAGKYIYTNHSPFQTEVTDPYFVKMVITDSRSSLKMVGFGKMNSYEDCQARAAIVWANTFKNVGDIKTITSCDKELPSGYKPLFENKTFNATYIVFDKGSSKERDGRFVIYGFGSTEVAEQCSVITQEVRKTYTGKIYCIQGTIG